MGPFKIFASDLENLTPGRELESEVQAFKNMQSFFSFFFLAILFLHNTQLYPKVLNAFIHATITRHALERKVFQVDSFQMTAMWQGSFKGLKKVTHFEISSDRIKDTSRILFVYVLSLTQWPLKSSLDQFVTNGTGDLWLVEYHKEFEDNVCRTSVYSNLACNLA